MITEISLTPKGDEQKYNPEISIIKLIFLLCSYRAVCVIIVY
jgi:hypothetical protein